MKLHRIALVLALLPAFGVPHAAETAKPGKPAPAAKAAKPSARGPGTQTEDELYIGAKAKSGASAQKRSQARKPKSAAGGDDDLEDLEVQRGKAKAK
ncbi:MAG: hypothetical protein IT503_19465 [Burkholderiaceae bacterium]|nr:hypothetical protein [Burkholderiaceae bacterium]